LKYNDGLTSVQWSNFEIVNLNWLRSPAYIDYFDHLDKAGGFFYERWGDAPVHSIAAALLLKQDEIHFFNEIGYYHVPFSHCPTGDKIKEELKCYCNPKENFDWKGYSCTYVDDFLEAQALTVGYQVHLVSLTL
jgi:alpha 1,2-mannosyltransferase